MVNALVRTISETTDVAAVMGVAGDVDDVVGGQHVIGIAMAVGHEIDVPRGPAGTEHPLEGPLLGVAGAVQTSGVRFEAHDSGVRPRVADDTGDVGLPQGSILLQDGDAVPLGGPAHRGEGAADRHCRAVGRHRDGADQGVIDLGGEVGHLVRLQIHRTGTLT